MSLMEKLKADHLSARKRREAVAADVLGTVISICENQAKAGKVAKPLTDGEIVAVVQGTAKKIAETTDLVSSVTGSPLRAQQIAKLQAELATLSVYLPTQLTSEELTEIAVRQHSLGLSIGQIMARLKSEHPGCYDAKEASAIVRGVVQP